MGVQQAFLDRVDDLARASSLEERVRQAADRENLIGAEAKVDFSYNMIAIDYVVEAPARFIPEARQERGSPALIRRLPSIVGLTRQPQRIQPQRLNLDRLADARRYHPVADFRIHPG
jgi:hypothetical protein